MRRTILFRRLLTGWLLSLTCFAFLAAFPRIELSSYDDLVALYRFLPNALSAFHRGYMGLHRSISLVGDDGEGANRNHRDQIAALRQLRQDMAAAACWITPQRLELPKDLQNEPLEKNLVFSEKCDTQWDGSTPEDPPFVVKPDPTDKVVREVYVALKSPGGLVPCLPLVLYGRYLNEPVVSPQVDRGNLLLGDQSIPVREDATGYTIPLVPYETMVLASSEMSQNETFVNDQMIPIALKTALQFPALYFGNRVRDRFYFLGEYSMTAKGEQVTSLGPCRDFQLAAISLDNLIQGPNLHWLSGPPLIGLNFLIASTLAIWLLSPTSLTGRAVRFTQVLVAWLVFSTAAFASGYYAPLTWVVLYAGLLSLWLAFKIWWSVLTYLRRYGGATAARLLATGKINLSHEVAEERIVSIVFIGLPGHLRQQELEGDPKTLEHRQIFSKQVADITYRHRGIVHDFQADYLMLGFGTHPGSVDADHALSAFRAANELISSRDFFMEAWSPHSPEGARVQVSINTGMVAVGWVGTSDYKRASAAIGDTTNVAARLLGTAKKLDVDLLLSESAYELLKDQARFEALPPVMLKGKTEAVGIYKMVVDSP